MKTLICLVALVLLSFSSGFGQSISKPEKGKIIKTLSDVIQGHYVLQDSVDLITDELSLISKSDEFESKQTANQYASYLTETLRSISKDAHFAVLHDEQMYAMALALQQNTPGESTPNLSFGGRAMNDRRSNFFFTKLEVLDGNVGYLKIDRIPALEYSKATVDAAMAFLKHTDALIVDLRSNPGGIGGFIPYFMSYFFAEERQLLYSREFLAWDSTSYHYTHQEIGGDRYTDKPLYVLINTFTGSAATNMAYTLKSFERATLVGENTGAGYRGAHSATILPLKDNFVALVPIGRVVNAKTNTNWRSGGVDPHIESPSNSALVVAHQKALETLLKKSFSAEVSTDIEEALKTLEERKTQKLGAPAAEDLSQYQGQYGDTTISWENGKLYTKRPTTPIKLEIQRKNGELFKIILPPNARGNVPDLLFNRMDGEVISLTTIRDGVEERTEKKAIDE